MRINLETQSQCAFQSQKSTSYHTEKRRDMMVYLCIIYRNPKKVEKKTKMEEKKTIVPLKTVDKEKNQGGLTNQDNKRYAIVCFKIL